MDSPTRLCYRSFVFLFVMMCDDSTIIGHPNVKNNTESVISYTNGSMETAAGTNNSREKNITLLIMGIPKPSVVDIIASSSRLPVSSYTLPEWITSVVCVVVIALVTITIIITYVKMSKPKRGNISGNHSSVEMSDVAEKTMEVAAVKKSAEKSHEEEIRMSSHGKVRQRKSSSSPTHDSCSIENECLQEKSVSKTKREAKEKGNEIKGRLCTVDYVKEIPEHSRLSETKTTGQNMMKYESRRSSEKSLPASDVRCSLEKTMRRGDAGYDDNMSNWENERKAPSGPGNSKKHAPKKPAEPLKMTPYPGQALRKIISDPCLIDRPPFLAAHTRFDNKIGQDSVMTHAQGQSLRRISSEPIRPAYTTYSPPIIKGSLKLDKKSLKELKSKIQKSKRKDGNGSKKFSPAAMSFTNEIYGSIEELRAPEGEPKPTVFEECETEPIYEVIQEKRANNLDQDGKHESKEGERKEVKEKRVKRENGTKKGSKISKHEYEPRKLDFWGSSPPEDTDGACLKQQLSSPRPAEVEEIRHGKQHEKCFENLSFSILEDLEEFDEDFDLEPNKVVDRIFEDVEAGQPSELPEALNQSTESLYEEIYQPSSYLTR